MARSREFLAAIFKRNKQLGAGSEARPSETGPHIGSQVLSRDHSDKGPGLQKTTSKQPFDVLEPRELSYRESISQDLWNTAYDNLKKGSGTSRLVDTYEKALILSANREHGDPGQAAVGNVNNDELECGPSERVVRMHDIVRRVLFKAQANQRLDSAVQQTAQLTRSALKVVGGLLEAYPPASIACAGICVALSLVINRASQNLAMLDGLVYVTDNLDWYLGMSSLTFGDTISTSQHEISHLRHTLKLRVIQLIQDPLEYEMKGVCSCYEDRPFVRVMRPMLAVDDWKTRLDSLKDKESEIGKHQPVPRHIRVHDATPDG